MQRLVQELLTLRTAAKEQRAASLAGAASSMGGDGRSGAAAAASGSLLSGATAGGQRAADPEKQLQEVTAKLAHVLRDVSKPEEGKERKKSSAPGC